jgi:hypothetical protein
MQLNDKVRITSTRGRKNMLRGVGGVREIVGTIETITDKRVTVMTAKGYRESFSTDGIHHKIEVIE